jgi:type II secretory pathway component PulM
MREWWLARTSRERGLIAAAAVMGALFLAMQLAIRPVMNWRNAASQRVEQAESGYQIVAQAAAAVAPENSAAGAATPARNALTDTARQLGVSLNFVNEHPDGSIEFQAGPVEPEKAFQLFSNLERDFAVRVIAADIARSPEAPQQVRLQATLSR